MKASCFFEWYYRLIRNCVSSFPPPPIKTVLAFNPIRTRNNTPTCSETRVMFSLRYGPLQHKPMTVKQPMLPLKKKIMMLHTSKVQPEEPVELSILRRGDQQPRLLDPSHVQRCCFKKFPPQAREVESVDVFQISGRRFGAEFAQQEALEWLEAVLVVLECYGKTATN